MSSTLNVIITDAGIAEVVNAQHTGTAPVVLTQVGFGRGIYTPTADQTALHDEIKRVSTIGGGVVGSNIMHIQALDSGEAAYAVYEIGVYTASGTLFAVYSQPMPILHKVANSSIMCAIDFVLAGVEPTAVTVGDTDYTLAPATTTNLGVVELATNSEAQEGSDDARAVTPAALASVTATDSRAGLIEIATQTETDFGSDTERAITPATLLASFHTVLQGLAAGSSTVHGAAGALGLFGYAWPSGTADNTLLQVGAEVDGSALTPAILSVNSSGGVVFSQRSGVSRSGKWMLLSEARYSSSDPRAALVLAVRRPPISVTLYLSPDQTPIRLTSSSTLYPLYDQYGNRVAYDASIFNVPNITSVDSSTAAGSTRDLLWWLTNDSSRCYLGQISWSSGLIMGLYWNTGYTMSEATSITFAY